MVPIGHVRDGSRPRLTAFEGQKHWIMGGNLSTISPSSAAAAVDSYVAELGDVQYEKRHQTHSSKSLIDPQLELCSFPQDDSWKVPIWTCGGQDICQTKHECLRGQVGPTTGRYFINLACLNCVRGERRSGGCAERISLHSLHRNGESGIFSAPTPVRQSLRQNKVPISLITF